MKRNFFFLGTLALLTALFLGWWCFRPHPTNSPADLHQVCRSDGVCWMTRAMPTFTYKQSLADEDWEYYNSYVKPGLFPRDAFWHVDRRVPMARSFIVANEGTSSLRFGIEMKFIGYNVRHLPDNSQLRIPPVTNNQRTAVAKITAPGAVYDTSTNGATASCFVFRLQPHEIIEIPFETTANISGANEIDYAVLVKTGARVSCQTEKNNTSSLIQVGLLDEHTGAEYRIDEVDISVGTVPD